MTDEQDARLSVDSMLVWVRQTVSRSRAYLGLHLQLRAVEHMVLQICIQIINQYLKMTEILAIPFASFPRHTAIRGKFAFLLMLH